MRAKQERNVVANATILKQGNPEANVMSSQFIVARDFEVAGYAMCGWAEG
jgi:hypothetical protein